jgi:hypothetical protein
VIEGTGAFNIAYGRWLCVVVVVVVVVVVGSLLMFSKRTLGGATALLKSL